MVQRGSTSAVSRILVAAPLLAIVFAVGLVLVSSSGTGEVEGEPPVEQRRFVSRDNSFQFKYPRSLVTCEKDTQNKDCQTYIAICDQDALACVAYPRARYEGYTFEGAAFSVNEHPEADTETKCLASMPPPVRKESIQGVEFQGGHDSSAAAGHGLEEDSYRAFHDGRCYELDIRIAMSSIGGYVPGTIKEFTEKHQQEVRAYLAKVKSSFVFLK